jgi:putative FmdB family regulatory protein
MPIYEYRCTKGHDFDQFSTVEDRNRLRFCPTCERPATKVILHAPRVFGDFEGYESPASGKWVEGRRARERDFQETGTRPYEAGEREEMVRRQSDNDRRMDATVDRVVEQTLNEITL